MSGLIPNLERPAPVAGEISKPLWDAANQKKLVLQRCTVCHKLQYPPRQSCNQCTSKAPLVWEEVKGQGHIDVYFVIRDSRIRGYRPAQPINFAIVTLDEDPGINFLSNLPGTPVGEVPIGAPVEVVFDTASPSSSQLVHEWQVVKSGTR